MRWAEEYQEDVRRLIESQGALLIRGLKVLGSAEFGKIITTLRQVIAHCQLPEAGGYTPSDFPDADLSQSELDDLIANIGQPEMQD